MARDSCSVCGGTENVFTRLTGCVLSPADGSVLETNDEFYVDLIAATEFPTHHNDGRICNTCISNLQNHTHISAIEPEPDPVEFAVTCSSCQTKFIGFAPSQAYHCAADVYPGFVVGYYGSTVADLLKLSFREGYAHNLPTKSQICDDCITLLRNRGDLILSTNKIIPF